MCWVLKPARFSMKCLSFPIREVCVSSGMTGNTRQWNQAGVLKWEKVDGTPPGLTIMSMRYRSDDRAMYAP